MLRPQPTRVLDMKYRLLSMQQVMTVPPTEREQAPVERYFWSVLPIILFFLPVMVEVLIYLNDLGTRPYGETLNVPATTWLYRISFGLLVLNSVVTFSCFWLWVAITSMWRRTFEDLRESAAQN